jgi:hypothetical protein
MRPPSGDAAAACARPPEKPLSAAAARVSSCGFELVLPAALQPSPVPLRQGAPCCWSLASCRAYQVQPLVHYQERARVHTSTRPHSTDP